MSESVYHRGWADDLVHAGGLYVCKRCQAAGAPSGEGQLYREPPGAAYRPGGEFHRGTPQEPGHKETLWEHEGREPNPNAVGIDYDRLEQKENWSPAQQILIRVAERAALEERAAAAALAAGRAEKEAATSPPATPQSALPHPQPPPASGYPARPGPLADPWADAEPEAPQRPPEPQRKAERTTDRTSTPYVPAEQGRKGGTAPPPAKHDPHAPKEWVPPWVEERRERERRAAAERPAQTPAPLARRDTRETPAPAEKQRGAYGWRTLCGAAGFTMAPNLVLRSEALSDTARLTYLLLIDAARERPAALISQQELAQALGRHRDTARKALEELEAIGLITLHRGGLMHPNRCTFETLTDMLAEKLERSSRDPQP